MLETKDTQRRDCWPHREEDLADEIEQAHEYMEHIHEALARMDKALQESTVAIRRGPATGRATS